MKKTTIFTGCATAMITPFTEDLKEVDYKGFEKLLDFQIENNADAVVVCGTTGESSTLSKSEKLNLFEISVNCCKNKIPVIAGTGSNNTWETVNNSNEAEKKGVDALLLVTPFYNKCTQEGVIKHYFTIADRVSVPIIVYNVPSRTGFSITHETYRALSEHPRICGVKEANPDISEFVKSYNLCSEYLDFYSGNDDLTNTMITNGAKGVISVASNIIPDIIHEMSASALNGNYNRASFLFYKHLQLFNDLFCEVNPSPVKYAVNQIFGLNSSLRLPLTDLSEKNRNIILDDIGKLKIKQCILDK